jgi:hypothetical protein
MASITQEQKRLFFCFSRAHVFQTILSTDVKEKVIAALISVLKMVHSAHLLIIDVTGKSNRLSSPYSQGNILVGSYHGDDVSFI